MKAIQNILLLIGLGLVVFWIFKRENDYQKMEQIVTALAQADTSEVKANESEVVSNTIEKHYYHEKEIITKETKEVVQKYDAIEKNLDSAKCNEKLEECAEDVKAQADRTYQAQRGCDSVIEAKNKTIAEKNNVIKDKNVAIEMMQPMLKRKRFVLSAGVGGGVNSDLQLAPNVGVQLGYKLVEF